MRQRYWILLTSLLFVALLGSVVLIFDSAISLTYSRSHSESRTRRCLLLAQLAKPTLLVGYDEAAVTNLVGPDTLVKTDAEGERLAMLVSMGVLVVVLSLVAVGDIGLLPLASPS